MSSRTTSGTDRAKAVPKGAERLEEADRVFSALAHPSRRHVLMVLHFRGGSMTAGEIADRFACTWPTTSRHLKVLEQAGLVSVERRGRERLYKLEKKRLRDVTNDWLKWFDESPK